MQEFEVARLVATFQVGAEGLEAGIEAAQRSLEGLDLTTNKTELSLRNAVQAARISYQMAAADADRAANRAKAASGEEKAALEATAATAQQAAADKKAAFDAAALAYEAVAAKARDYEATTQKMALSNAAMAAAAVKGFSTLVSTVRSGYDARQDQILQELRLEQVMKNTMGARKAEVDSIRQVIAAQRQLGIVSREAQTAGAQELATYLNMSESLKVLLPVLNDMSAQQLGVGASAESVAGIATMLGKVMEGQTSALSRYGYSFDEVQESILKTGTEMERAAVLAEVIGASVGGMNEQLRKEFSDTSETAKELSVAFGDSLAPAVNLVNDVWGIFLGGLRDYVQANPAVVAGLTSGAGALLLIVGASKGLTAVSAAMKMLTGDVMIFGIATKAALPWLAALGALVGVATALYTSHANAARAAAGAEREAAEERRSAIAAQQEGLSQIKELAAEYDTLSRKTDKTIAEKRRLADIERELSEQYGISTEGLDGQKLGFESVSTALRELIELRRQDNLAAMEQDATYRMALLKPDFALINQLKSDRAEIESEVTRINERLSEIGTDPFEQANVEGLRNLLGTYEEELEIAGEKLAAELMKMQTHTEAAIDKVTASIQQKAPEMSDAMLSVVEEMYRAVAEADPDAATTNAFVDKFTAMLSDLDLTDALKQLQSDLAQLDPTDALFNEQREARINEFFAGIPRESRDALAKMTEGVIEAGDVWELFDSALSDVINGFDAVSDAAEGIGGKVRRAGEDAGEEWREGFERGVQGATRSLNAALDSRDALAEDLKAWQALNDERMKGSEAYEAAVKRINQQYGDGAARNLEATRAQIDERMALATREEENALALLRILEEQTEARRAGLYVNLHDTDNQEEWLAYTLQILEADRELLNIRQALARTGDLGALGKIRLAWGNDLTGLDEVLRAAEPQIREQLNMLAPILVTPKIEVTEPEVFGPSLPPTGGGYFFAEKLGLVPPEGERINLADLFDLGSVEGVAAALGYINTELETSQEKLADLRAVPYFSALRDEAAITAEETRISALEISQAFLEGLALDASPAKQELASLLSDFQSKGALVSKALDQSPAMDKLNTALKATKTSTGALTGELLALAQQAGYSGKTIEGAARYVENWANELDSAQTDVDDLGNRILALLPLMSTSGEITVDTADAIRELIALGNVGEGVAKLLEEMGVSSAQRKGGGGKKKDAGEEARRAAEAAYKAQVDAWQKELDEQLKFLERKKRMGEINTQEEIRQLEIIAAQYARTTEQKIAMEDRLFEARARLRDEEIAEIDKLNQGIITALRNRYEEQRKIENDRLNDSRDAWRKWGDENVKAIQRQIDALDELVKYEDREAQEKAKRRKIEATRQMLEYETDIANRERLQKELQRLEEDLSKWQRQNAIADEKERLRAEQEAIRERVQVEQEAIAKQSDELAKVYDERLKDAALRAEAERMLTQSSQEQILDLIGSYAPDYEATGKTLGERLINGLTSIWGPVTDFFGALNAQINAVQDNLAQTALDAADAFYVGRQMQGAAQVSAAPTTITQEININQPVESPAEMARRMQKVNEELARMLV